MQKVPEDKILQGHPEIKSFIDDLCDAIHSKSNYKFTSLGNNLFTIFFPHSKKIYTFQKTEDGYLFTLQLPE